MNKLKELVVQLLSIFFKLLQMRSNVPIAHTIAMTMQHVQTPLDHLHVYVGMAFLGMV
jgi:hypothetical protein